MTRACCRLWLSLALGLAGVPSPAVAAAQSPPQGQVAGSAEATATADDLIRVADEVAREVEALRGWTFTQPVRKRLVSPQQVRQYLEKQLETALPPGQIAVVQAFLRTIGLIPPGCDLKATALALLENQIAGYYEPDTKTMNLVPRPGGVPAIVERIMLAHELTHALDDQHADLKALITPSPTRTEDSDIVISSVIEGSATGLMLQYLARAQKAGRVDLQELVLYAAREMERSKAFLDAPRYFSAMLASYICGMQFLTRGDVTALMMADDNRAIGANLLAARKDLPRSSEQILHPAKYWNPAERDEPVIVSDEAAEKWLAQPGRWVVHRNTVGELLVALLAAPRDRRPDLATMQTAEGWTTPAARGWGGDRFYLLGSGRDAADAARSLTDLRGVWVTVWDSQGDRDEFVATLPQSSVPAAYAVMPMGTFGAVVLIGFDDTERGRLAAQLDRTPLPLTRNGTAWPPPAR
ncbi:MAG: hypothetical protein IMZ67_02555 [Acidobacteria bacterium]|nr:hypothetical protein [Acidobacteriota bacterium]